MSTARSLVLTAALLAIPSAGCDCPNEDVTRPAQAGTYELGDPGGPCSESDAGLPPFPVASDLPNSALTLSADRSTVVQTYVQSGTTYRVEYEVTAISSIANYSGNYSAHP
jgi:hypothetical protein